MRTILFRGQLVDTKEWIFGDIIQLERDFKKVVEILDWSKVDKTKRDLTVIPETVGQFTGLTDKNGVKIFEGDICVQPELNGSSKFMSRCKIEYKEDSFKLSWITNSWYNEILRNHNDKLEVVGNIHDNPELLQV